MDLEEQYFCNPNGLNKTGCSAKSYLETQGISEALKILHKSILQGYILKANLSLNPLAQEK